MSNDRRTTECALDCAVPGLERTACRAVVVIVNFRTAELTINCLQSLTGEVEGVPGMGVVVADNASGDGFAERIESAIRAEGWSSWATVLRLGRNGGFAFGNNAAIREALKAGPAPDYFLLLNPDTIARPGAVEELVSFMDSRPEVGIAGSLLEDARGTVQQSAHRKPSPLTELESGARLRPLSRLLHGQAGCLQARDVPWPCDWVSGASMMVRREVLETAGLMDEGYFLYYDEVDLCSRARDHGWQVWSVPASRVMHLEGAVTGFRDVRTRRGRYWYDSRRRFFIKNYGIAGLLAADALWACGRLSLAVRRALHLGGSTAGDPKLFAFDLLWGDAKAILTGAAFRIRPARQERVGR